MNFGRWRGRWRATGPTQICGEVGLPRVDRVKARHWQATTNEQMPGGDFPKYNLFNDPAAFISTDLLLLLRRQLLYSRSIAF